MEVFRYTHRDIDNAMVLYFIQQTKSNKATISQLTTRKGRVVSTVVSCPIPSMRLCTVPVFGNTLTSVLERKGQFDHECDRNAAHLGTSAREDSGHLPIELLGHPKAAGLVEKGVDLRDRAAVARRDLSNPAPKSRSSSSVPPSCGLQIKFFTREDR